MIVSLTGKILKDKKLIIEDIQDGDADNDDDDNFKPRYIISIFRVNGQRVYHPDNEREFHRILENPLHFRRLVRTEPMLHFSLLWRYNTLLYLKKKIHPKVWLSRIAYTILLNESSSTSHNIWQYYGTIETLSLALIVISKQWAQGDFKQLLFLNLNDISAIIFIAHVYQLFENKKYAQNYMDYSNGRSNITVWRPNSYNLLNWFEMAVKKILKRLPSNKLNAMKQYFKLLSYDKIKCGNINCNKNYLKDQYNFQLSIITCDKLSRFSNKRVTQYIEKVHEKWASRMICNQWKICKNCKRIKYCSRRCQKISWNQQDHAKKCFNVINQTSRISKRRKVIT